MKITTGIYEIFDSGTVISYGNESVSFHLAEDLKATLTFRSDNESKEHRMDFNPISNNELEIVLFNFNNSLGTGNTVPLQIGTLNNRELHLNFRVYTLKDESNRTIHYTWYLGKEVQNG